MDLKFSDADISAFLKDIIELGGVETVDDSPDKYIRVKSTGEQQKLTVDGVAKPLAIYGTKAADAILINPFAEGETTSARNSWFEASRNIILAGQIVKIVKVLLQAGVEQHKRKSAKDKKKEEALPMNIIKYLDKDALDIDEKMIKEFDTISRELHKFLVIHYNRSERQGEVKCLVFVDAQRKSFGSVRVKSWEVFKHLIGRILDTDDMKTFDYKPSTIGIPAFESFVNILVNIYKRIQEPLQIINREDPKLGELESHLKYLPEYYSIAKWAVAPVVNSVTAAPTGVPQAGVVVPTTGVPTTSNVPTASAVPVPDPMPVGMPAYVPNPAPVPMPQAVPPYGVPSAMVSNVPGPQVIGMYNPTPNYMPMMSSAVPTASVNYAIPQAQPAVTAPIQSRNPFARA